MDVEKTRVSHSFEAFRSYFGVILVCTSLPEYQRDVAALVLNSRELSTSSVHCTFCAISTESLKNWDMVFCGNSTECTKCTQFLTC